MHLWPPMSWADFWGAWVVQAGTDAPRYRGRQRAVAGTGAVTIEEAQHGRPLGGHDHQWTGKGRGGDQLKVWHGARYVVH